ncbi:hypothetical protein ABVT39_006804 [Epinephelus coioides]
MVGRGYLSVKTTLFARHQLTLTSTFVEMALVSGESQTTSRAPSSRNRLRLIKRPRDESVPGRPVQNTTPPASPITITDSPDIGDIGHEDLRDATGTITNNSLNSAPAAEESDIENWTEVQIQRYDAHSFSVDDPQTEATTSKTKYTTSLVHRVDPPLQIRTFNYAQNQQEGLSLSDIEDETDQLCNGLYSDSEENWLEYEPLKSLSDVENEVDAIEEEDVEFTTAHSLHLLHDLGILKGNLADFLEHAPVNPTPQMGGNQTPQRHNNQVTGTVESNPHHHTCQKKGDA